MTDRDQTHEGLRIENRNRCYQAQLRNTACQLEIRKNVVMLLLT